MSRRDAVLDSDFEDAEVWRGRPLVFTLYALGAFAFIILLVVGWPRMNAFYQVAAPLGGLVFVWAMMRSLSNALHGRNVMLAIGPRGIFDWRIAPAWMPWPDVLKIEPVQKSGKATAGFRVTTTPEFANSFPETAMSRLLRWSNVLTTIKGYSVGFGGLDGSRDDIMRALNRYYPQWRNAKSII